MREEAFVKTKAMVINMVSRKSPGYRLFNVLNVIFMGSLGLITLLPVVHIIALSFSDNAAVTANAVGLIPKGFNIEAYKYIFKDSQFFISTWISIKRVVLGTLLNLVLIVLTAYPLAQSDKVLKGRKIIAWYFVFTTLFGGGLIPTYLLIRDVHLLDNFLALILPSALPVFSAIMLMNYIKGLPKDIFEASMIDGAGHFTIITKIVLPLSIPCLATLTLFSMVGYWNEWFSATIYINDSGQWPLQSLMRSLINQSKDIQKVIEAGNYEQAMKLSNKGLQAAQIVFSTLPILVSYPFLQRYFVKGIVVGAVKG